MNNIDKEAKAIDDEIRKITSNLQAKGYKVAVKIEQGLKGDYRATLEIGAKE